MTGYDAGRRVEYAAIDHLREQGYHCTRAASSKGTADVVAIKEGQVVLVSAKRTEFPRPAERAALVRLAACLPGVGVPVVVIGRPRLTWWRLVGTGPQDRVPWAADEVAS